MGHVVIVGAKQFTSSFSFSLPGGESRRPAGISGGDGAPAAEGRGGGRMGAVRFSNHLRVLLRRQPLPSHGTCLPILPSLALSSSISIFRCFSFCIIFLCSAPLSLDGGILNFRVGVSFYLLSLLVNLDGETYGRFQNSLDCCKVCFFFLYYLFIYFLIW